MTKRIFGTDGIRGRANEGAIMPELLVKLAIGAGHYFRRGEHSHKVVIGKDTRLSGYMIEPAITAGFVSAGMDVILLGPMPTPAVAMLTRSMRADIGVMISASHNPYQDNGIKFFRPDGHKLDDDAEREIERLTLDGIDHKVAEAEDLGRVKRIDDAPGRYIEFVKRTLPRRLTLDGLKIVIDCANGAAYHIAPTVFQELGAEVIAIGINPNGININDKCGATHTDALRVKVLSEKADIGIALDGDADRLIVIDEKGNVVDGDNVLALIATYWQKRNMIKGGGVVATVMSNMGLEKYLNSKDLQLYRTPVGDRYVSAYMRKHGVNVGGEQSGHVIFSNYSTAGDGILAALQVLAVIVEEDRPASEVCSPFDPYPQMLTNINFKGNDPLEKENVQKYIQSVQLQLGDSARILVRKSGTEQLIRVMLEGESRQTLESASNDIVSYIKQN